MMRKSLIIFAGEIKIVKTAGEKELIVYGISADTDFLR